LSPRKVVMADTDTTKPTMTGLVDQIDDEYQVGEEMGIDKTLIMLSDDVTAEVALRNSLVVKVYTSASTELPNISEDSSLYVFEFSAAGTYTLYASVEDVAGNKFEVTKSIAVLSNSAVNAKYERGFELAPSDFADTRLYSALLAEAVEYASSKGDRFTGDTLYSEMFLFPDFKEISITNANITSLDGIESVRLDYVEKISITNNKITDIKPEYFSDSENLKEINFATNQISSFELPILRNLEKVNLANNLLTQIDLSNCMGDEVDINLAANDIVALDNVKLPRADKITLNMIGNNLSSVNDSYFSETKFDLKVGVQGIKDISNPTSTSSSKGIRFYRTNIDGLGIKIYDNSVKVPVLVKSVTDADITSGNYYDIILPIGEYFYEYTLDGEPVYSKYNVEKNYYLSQSFVVKPTTATFKFEHKGEMYDEIGKVTGAVKVHLDSVDLDSGVQGKIMYSVNLGEWQEGDLVDCSAGGIFSVKVKVVCGDYESEEISIFFQTSLNAVIPDAVMFFIILFLAIMVFFIGVPIISKKFFRK